MRRAAALAALAVACGGGTSGPRERPRDVIEVVARRPGAAADTIDAELAMPIIRALAEVSRGVAGVAATSRVGQATIVVEIAAGVDASAVEADVHRALARIAGPLAAHGEPVRVNRVVRDVALGRFVLAQGGMTAAETAARWRGLDRDLVTIPGVHAQRVCGAAASEVRITIDPERASVWSLDLVRIVDETRVDDARTVEGIGEWLNDVNDVSIADVATIELAAVETCTAVTSEGAGIVTTMALGGAQRATTWNRVMTAARAAGDVRELPAPATLVATLDPPGELSGILAAMASLAARPEVRWTIVESEAAEVRLSIGLERGADPDAVAGFVDSAVPPVTAVHLSGAGLVVREAVIRAPDDRTIARTTGLAMTLGLGDAIARSGCIGCAMTEVTEPRIDPARLAPLGLHPPRVARVLDIAARGAVIHRLAIDGEIVPVRVVAGPDTSVPGGVVAGLAAVAADGELVPLADVASISTRRVPTAVLREGGERVVVVWARGKPGAMPDDVDRALRAAFPGATIRAAHPAF